jgi:transposase-like protein
MKFLRLLGVEVSHQTVYNWINKYIMLMKEYVEKITPNVSDTWRADELYVKIKGDMKYLFALMDDETRFWIAQEVAKSKYKHDARKLFELGKKVAGITASFKVLELNRFFRCTLVVCRAFSDNCPRVVVLLLCTLPRF